jgi:hypothetical protein
MKGIIMLSARIQPKKRPLIDPGMVVHIHIPSAWETGAGRSPASGQPGLHSKPCLEKHLIIPFRLHGLQKIQ